MATTLPELDFSLIISLALLLDRYYNYQRLNWSVDLFEDLRVLVLVDGDNPPNQAVRRTFLNFLFTTESIRPLGCFAVSHQTNISRLHIPMTLEPPVRWY